jgi:DNA-binding NtrC family response regulator
MCAQTVRNRRYADRRRILLVDDDTACLVAVSRMLEFWLPNVVVAMCSSPREALKQTAIDHFDLVISDISMPEMNGLDLLREIKNKFPEMPVILITGYASRGLEEHAKFGGAFALVTKPLDTQRLVRTITSALDAHSYGV